MCLNERSRDISRGTAPSYSGIGHLVIKTSIQHNSPVIKRLTLEKIVRKGFSTDVGSLTCPHEDYKSLPKSALGKYLKFKMAAKNLTELGEKILSREQINIK